MNTRTATGWVSKTLAVSIIALLATAGSANAFITTINAVLPSGGAEIRGSYNISWVSDGTIGDTVELAYSVNNFSNTIVLPPFLAFDASPYLFDTTALPDGSLYRLQVKNTAGSAQGQSASAFTIDNTAPTTSIGLVPAAPDGPNGRYVTTPTITLSCVDAPSGCGNTFYRWNGGAWTTYTAPFLAIEGSSSFDWYSEDQAVDFAGVHNVEVFSTQAIHVDTTAPTVALSATAGSFTGPYTVTATFSEPVMGFTLSDVQVVSNNAILTDFASVSASIYTFTVRPIVEGAISLSVPAASAKDLADHDNVVSNTLGSLFDLINFNVTTKITSAEIANDLGQLVASTSKWVFYNDETDAVTGSLGSFVSGPASAPLGTGSAQISVTGTERRNLATYRFSGMSLWDIRELKFSTYNPSAGNGGSVNRSGFLTFNIDFNGSDTWQRRISFSPSQNGTVIQDVWQEWDALTNGNALWSHSGPTWPMTAGGVSGVAGTTLKTWKQILVDYPLARIRVTDAHLGIRVGEPYVSGYTENIDNFVFGYQSGVNLNASIFDFDQDITPPTITEVTPIANPTNDATPSYVFTSDEPGVDVTYGGGACGAGDLTTAVLGTNTITFNALGGDGVFAGCSIQITDSVGNPSNVLIIPTFEVDTVVAVVSTITTTDSDLNGTVDTATIIFSDEVNDASFTGATFTVGGSSAVFSTGSIANDNTIVLSVAGLVGTNAKVVAYSAGSGTDLAGNTLSFFSSTSLDGAAPVLLSAITTSTTTLDVVFSEDLDGGTVNSSGSEFAVAGATISSASESGGVVTLTYSALGTGTEPLVTFTNSGTFTDLASVQASTPQSRTAVDGVAPVLTLVQVTSSNINPVYAKAGDTITLTFTASEAISTPSVAIQGMPATTISNLGSSSWSASRVMTLGDTQGVVGFAVVFADDALPTANTGVTVIATTDASTVFYDSVNPVVDAGTDKEVNIEISQDATASDPALSSGYSLMWTQVSGPGTVDFGTPAAEDTTLKANIDGAYVLVLTATDMAGNVTSDSMTFIWDTTPPEPLTSFPSHSSTGVNVTAGTATVTYDEDIILSDDARITLVQEGATTSLKLGLAAVQGGDGNSGVLTIGYSALASGTTYRINVKSGNILTGVGSAVRDVAGNWAHQSWVSNFTTAIDSSVPVVNLFSAGSITMTDAVLSVTTNESANCAYATTDSAFGVMTAFGTTGGITHSQALSGLSPSTTYNYYVRCQDTSAQLNTMTASAHTVFTTSALVVDTTAPAITSIALDLPAYRITQDANINVTVHEDDTAVAVVINGISATEGVAGTWTASFAHAQLAVGTYSFNVEVTDLPGNERMQLVQYEVVSDDTAPAPSVVVLAPSAGATFSSTQSFTFQTNGGATVALEISIDGGSWALATTNADPGTFDIDTATLADGSHTVRARDVVAGTAGYSNYVTFLVDNAPAPVDETAPVINSFTVGSISSSSVELSVVTDENANCAFGPASEEFALLTLMSSTGGTIHTQSISGLSASTAYTYFVRCQDTTAQLNTMSTSEVASFETLVDDSTAVLSVTGTAFTRQAALADNNFDNGWRWILDVTVPTVESSLSMKFQDFVSQLGSIPAAGNVRFYSAQSSNASNALSAVVVSAADTHEGGINLVSDLSSSVAGRQIQVVVEVKVPVGSAGGAYSAGYGVKSQ